MRKILLLGGSAQQIIAIDTAKRLGYDTILCDYLPDNPGQNYTDRFYPVSTTDKEAVMQIAIHEGIDGILAYASDPAAPTAAYVAEKLSLPGNPYKSVEILCDKEKFRNFLKTHDFNVPKAKGYSDVEEALNDLQSGVFRLPVIAKPVDSSGSKGVSRIDRLTEALEKLSNAMSFSRKGRIIVETYVENFGYQIAGDGLSINGQLVFRFFGNDHFDSCCINPFVPVSASFPYHTSEEIQNRVHCEIQRLITLLGMRTATYNFDIRIDEDHNVYLMEVAPRSGGNYIPQIIRYATGVDLVEYSVRAAMGEKLACRFSEVPKGYWSYYAVHSLKDGILKQIAIDEKVISDNIVENHLLKKPGDMVTAFTGANTTLGILLMKFENMNQMLDMMEHPNKWIEVIVEEDLSDVEKDRW